MKAVRFSLTVAMMAVSAATVMAQTLAEGISLMEKENFSGARQIFRQLLAKDPNNADPYFYIGETFYDNEKIDSARFYYNKGVEINKNALCYAGLGKLLLDANNPKEAQKQIDYALRYGRKNAKAIVAAGRAFIDGDNKSPDRAIEILSPATADYKDPALFEALGDAYILKNDGGKAVSNYEFAIDKDKKNPKYYMKKAQIWTNAKVYEEAIKSLEDVIKMDANYAPAYKRLVDLYYTQNKYAKVTEMLQKYTSLVDNDLDARESYAKFLYFQAKAYDKAIAEAENILKTDPSRYVMHRVIGMSAFEQGNYQKAYEAFEHFFYSVGDRKVYPSDYEIYGKAAEKLNNREVAIKSFLKVADMDSTRSDIYDNLAKTFRDGKEYAKALDVYNRKMARTGLGTNDYYYIGFCNYYIDSLIAADTAFAKYCELFPNVAGFTWRARVASKLDPELKEWRAKPFYEKIVELGEKDRDKNKKSLIEAYNYLASNYFNAAQDNEKAKGYLQKTLELDPENKFAKDMMEGIK